MGRREHSFFSIPLKPQIFITPEIRRNGRKWEGMKLDLMIFFFFTKTPKIPQYIQPFILKLGSNSNIVIK